ncbi:hypothetical protein LguiB_020794 [Lonicera macranthoides]
MHNSNDFLIFPGGGTQLKDGVCHHRKLIEYKTDRNWMHNSIRLSYFSWRWYPIKGWGLSLHSLY